MRWVVIVIAAYAIGCDPEAGPGDAPTPYLDAAVRTGTWLQAQQSDSTGAPDRVDADAASFGLGSGGAGRALFFAELYAATEDEAFLRSAMRDVRSALARLPDSLPDLSLYGGLTGVAFAAAEVGTLGSDRDLTEEGRRLFGLIAAAAPDRGGDGLSDVYDVLGGAAGMGLGLLYAHRIFEDPAILAAAVRIGDALLGVADSPREGELRWMRGRSQQFDLPNFSHGTAGVGFFLTRLGAETGFDRFTTAGRSAAAYLDSVARSVDGAFLVPYGVPNDGYATPYDIGWAHGPAGTSRLHYALWRADGDDTMRTRLEAGARAILLSGVPGASSDSTIWRGPFAIDRRFGSAGAASFLLDAGRVTDDRSFSDRGFLIADHLVESATRTPSGDYWSVPLYGFQGGEGTAVFTGYFYGSAGFGLALLHAHLTATGGTPRIRLPDDPFDPDR